MEPLREEPVCGLIFCVFVIFDESKMQEPRQRFFSAFKLSSSVSSQGQWFQSESFESPPLCSAIAAHHLFLLSAIQVFSCWATNYHTLSRLSLTGFSAQDLTVLKSKGYRYQCLMWRLVSSFKIIQVIGRIRVCEIVGLGFLLSCWLSTDTLTQGLLERPLIYYDIVDIRWCSLGSVYPILLTASSHNQGERMTQGIHTGRWAFWGLSENSACHTYSMFFSKSTHFLNVNTFIKLSIGYLMCCVCMFKCLSLYIYSYTN